MSKTIDDFRDFIKDDKRKILFDLKNNIDAFLTLINGSKKRHDINIIVDIGKDILLNAHPNELIQCYMNLYNNSKDAFNELEILDRVIMISGNIQNNKIVIKVKDNAGGIEKKILEKIFEPYFTTKHKSQGTGLGLHMTYNLIVDSMDGNIEVKNVYFQHNGKKISGSEFTITFDTSM